MTTDPIYSLDDVLKCLEDAKLRATYKAVGTVTGIHWRGSSLSSALVAAGGPSPRTSWVVQQHSGKPSPGAGTYHGDKTWWHDDLFVNVHVIIDPDELRQEVTKWKQAKDAEDGSVP